MLTSIWLLLDATKYIGGCCQLYGDSYMVQVNRQQLYGSKLIATRKDIKG